MKTRELLTCDIKTFGNKLEGMRAKELGRHIGRIAQNLGETDVDALMQRVVDAVFSDEGLPERHSEEMARVLGALEERIQITEDNEDKVLRLMALCVAFLRQGMRHAVRNQRLAERQGHHHHGGHRCDDPHCAEHGHEHEAKAAPAEDPVARGIRSAID